MSTKRRTLIVGILTAGALSISTGALASGPSGSSEDGANNVTCSGTALPTGGHVVYAGTNGVEACNSDPAASANGRVIVSIEGRYVAVDGANDNTGTAYGWIRVSQGGVACGSEDPSNTASGAEADNSTTAADNDSTLGGGDQANCTD